MKIDELRQWKRQISFLMDANTFLWNAYFRSCCLQPVYLDLPPYYIPSASLLSVSWLGGSNVCSSACSWKMMIMKMMMTSYQSHQICQSIRVQKSGKGDCFEKLSKASRGYYMNLRWKCVSSIQVINTWRRIARRNITFTTDYSFSAEIRKPSARNTIFFVCKAYTIIYSDLKNWKICQLIWLK